MNRKTGMHPFISISIGGGLHVPFISTSMQGVGWGVVYDLKIESKINLAGNAILKIYVIDY